MWYCGSTSGFHPLDFILLLITAALCVPHGKVRRFAWCDCRVQWLCLFPQIIRIMMCICDFISITIFCSWLITEIQQLSCDYGLAALNWPSVWLSADTLHAWNFILPFKFELLLFQALYLRFIFQLLHTGFSHPLLFHCKSETCGSEVWVGWLKEPNTCGALTSEWPHN